MEKINVKISRYKGYVLESLRYLSIINFVLITDVWRQQYKISMSISIILFSFLLIGSVIFGFISFKYFKEGENKAVFDTIPQIKEIQNDLDLLKIGLLKK